MNTWYKYNYDQINTSEPIPGNPLLHVNYGHAKSVKAIHRPDIWEYKA